jgi:hypothetical protein
MPHRFSYSAAPVQQEPPKIGLLCTALLMAGGVHPQTMIERCGTQEIFNTKIRGAILILSCLFTALSFCTVAHLAVGSGSFSFGLALASVGLAALIGTTDNYVWYCSSIYSQGLTELANAGLQIQAPVNSSSTRLVFALRVLQGATLGLLSGLFLTVAANITDINARIESDYLYENRFAAAEVSKPIDAEIARASDAVTAQNAQVGALTRQVVALQTETRRAVSAGRRTSNVSAPALETQLVAFERKRTDETAKLDELKGRLAKLVAGRNEAVMKAIETAPQHSPRRDGFLGKLNALDAITRENPKLLLMILALELIALGMELAPVLAKQRYVPSTYAAIVTLEQLTATASLAHDGAKRLAQYDEDEARKTSVAGHGDAEGAPHAANSNSPHANNNHRDAAHGADPATVSKRKRGRPPKATGLNGSTPAMPE